MISPGDRWWRYDSPKGQTPPRRGTGEDTNQVDERKVALRLLHLSLAKSDWHACFLQERQIHDGLQPTAPGPPRFKEIALQG